MDFEGKKRVVRQLSGFVGSQDELWNKFHDLCRGNDYFDTEESVEYTTTRDFINYCIKQGWVYLREIGIYGVYVSS